jgi:hypothetical protein
MRISELSVVLGLVFVTACGSGDAETPATGEDSATDDTAAAADTTTTTDAPADSSVTTDTATSTDTTTSTDAPSDTSMTTCTMSPDAGAKCNELKNSGSDVVLVITAMPIPTGTGGTIANGRYTLTEFKSYLGSLLPAGQTLNQTIEICGEVGNLVSNDKGKPEVHKTFTIKPSGTSPNLTGTCSTQMPDVAIPYASYTATATTLTLYSTTYQFSATYTKS